MKKIIILLLLFNVPTLLFALGKKTISGLVRDSLTGESLIGATIWCPEIKMGTATNAFGFFSITIPESTTLIEVSFIGYKSKAAHPDSLTHLGNTIYLYPGIEIKEVSILSNRKDERGMRENINSMKLKIEEVKYIPSLFGENDLVKVIQLMPGVQSGGEGKSELHIRGGSPDQNLVLLDDVQLYYISHFGGIFSIFNSDALHHAELIKGGFPARFGGRLSSVLDIRMKDGNVNGHKKHMSIGLLSSRITFEGPVSNQGATYLVAARRSILPLMKIMTRNLENSFGDFNAKLALPVSDKDKLFASFYWGNDHIKVGQNENGNQLKFGNNWGNRLASVRWNHLFSSKVFSNTTLSAIGYHNANTFKLQHEKEGNTQKIDSETKTKINDLNAKYDLRWSIDPKFTLNCGILGTFHRYIPNSEKYVQSGDKINTFSKSYQNRADAIESAAYIENDYSNGRFGANIGFRYSRFYVEKTTYQYIEPRVLLNLKLSNWLFINGTYSEMNQFTHLLSVSTVGMPSDYWMPATESIPPQYSRQVTTGINMPLGDGQFHFSADAYYKTMSYLVDFKEGAILYGNFDNWENTVEKNGIGFSKGIELQLKKETGKTTGWISYTRAKSERRFESINNNKYYPYRYDRRNNISIVLNHKLNREVIVSAVWQYGTGYPFTPAIGKFVDAIGGQVLLWGNRNSGRMRNYHRLDISAHIPHNIGRLNGVWNISILNIYNRKNPYYYFYGKQGFSSISGTANGNETIANSNDNNGLHLFQQSLFPFFPSVAYSFSF